MGSKVKGELTESEYMMLSEYEQHMYKPSRRGISDEYKEKTLMQQKMLQALGSEIPVTMPDGSIQIVTAMDMVINKSIMDAIQNPTMSKLRDIFIMTGEMEKREKKEEKKEAKDIFSGIVIDESGESKK